MQEEEEEGSCRAIRDSRNGEQERETYKKNSSSVYLLIYCLLFRSCVEYPASIAEWELGTFTESIVFLYQSMVLPYIKTNS